MMVVVVADLICGALECAYGHRKDTQDPSGALNWRRRVPDRIGVEYNSISTFS